ncbi:MAG: hypothetical protein J6L23_02110 [Clostridia bacterium]|nr:hypothetical protein [Clostridia bacterium]
MKLFGLFLVVSSFTFTGVALAIGSETSIKQLRVLVELIRHIRLGISHTRLPIWVILDGFETKERSMRSFFLLLCDKHNVDSTAARFERAASLLDSDAREICISLGKELGRCPFDEELKRLDRLEAEAMEMLSNRSATLKRTKRIYTTVFPLVGLVVSILML